MSTLENNNSFDAVLFDERDYSTPLLKESSELNTPQSILPFVNSESALTAFEEDLSDFEKVDYYLENSLLLFEHKEFDDSIKLAEKALETEPLNINAIDLLWRSHWSNGEYEKAIDYLKSWIEQREEGEPYYHLGEIYYNLGDDTQAHSFYLKAIKLFPQNSRVLFEIFKNLGNIYVRGGDYDGAAEQYNRAFRINPNSPALLVNLGTLEIQKQNYVNARSHFEEAIKISADEDRAWIGLALVYRQLGEFDLAWANLQQALDRNPGNMIAIQQAVNWGAADLKFDIGIESIEKYLKTYEENPDLIYTLAGLMFHKKQYKESMEIIERLLSKYPERQDALELKGIIEGKWKR